MKLSIIIPIYNAEQYITRCMDSVMSQENIDNYEVICVNDGSTDGSEALIKKYVDRYSNCKLVNTKNQGAFLARQRGIEESTGDWIGFLDCDDVIVGNMYRIMLERTKQQENIDMVVCAFRKVMPMTGKIKDIQMNFYGDAVYDFEQQPNERGILTAVNPAYWNKLYRRNVAMEAIRLEYSPRIMEDYIFFASVIPFVRGVAFVSAPLYDYYDTAGSATKTIGWEELCVAKTALIDLVNYLEGRKLYQDALRKRLVDTCTCVHLGIAFTINYNNFSENDTLRKVWQDTYDFLNCYFKEWKKNDYIKWSYIKDRRQLFKVYLGNKMYSKSSWVFLVKVYHIVCKLLGKDLKW